MVAAILAMSWPLVCLQNPHRPPAMPMAVPVRGALGGIGLFMLATLPGGGSGGCRLAGSAGLRRRRMWVTWDYSWRVLTRPPARPGECPPNYKHRDSAPTTTRASSLLARPHGTGPELCPRRVRTGPPALQLQGPRHGPWLRRQADLVGAPPPKALGSRGAKQGWDVFDFVQN